MDTTKLVNGSTINPQQQPLQPGHLSASQPAPTHPDDLAYVIVDDHTTDYNYACKFTMMHGAAFPAQGTECLVGFDYNNNPYLVWWAGSYTTPTWYPLPFAAHWSNYGGNYRAGQYCIDVSGFVHVRGLVAKSTPWTSADVIATLPVGYRPARGQIELFTTVFDDNSNGAVFTRVDVLDNGQIMMQSINVPNFGTPGTVAYLSVSGISFAQGA